MPERKKCKSYLVNSLREVLRKAISTQTTKMAVSIDVAKEDKSIKKSSRREFLMAVH